MATYRNRLATTVSAVASAGLGAFTIGTALTKFTTFSAADNGLPFTVTITEGNSWEVRKNCIYTQGSPSTLSRGDLESSSTGSPIAFTTACIIVNNMSAAELFGMDISDYAYYMPLPGTAAANVTALTAALQSGKTVIIFKAGEYQFDAAITQSVVGKTFRGQGAGRTTLKMVNSHNIDYLLLSSAGASGTVFEHLTFDGNTTNSTNTVCGLLKADQSTISHKFTLRDMVIKNVTYATVRLWPYSSEFTMERCRLEYADDVVFEPGPWVKCVIRDNVFLDYGMAPTYASATGPVFLIQGESDGWIIEGNQFYPGTGTGYFAIEAVSSGSIGVRGAVINGNIFDSRNALNGNNSGTGISGHFEDSVISNNTWRNGRGGSWGDGIELVGRRNNISGNTCHNGMFVVNHATSPTRDCKGTVISNNTFNHYRTSALLVSQSLDSITLTNVTGVIVEGNSFYYETGTITGGAGILVTGASADSVSITNNYFNCNDIVMNAIKVNVTAGTNVLIKGNTFENLYRAVNIDANAGAIVEANTFISNSDADINITATTSGTFSGYGSPQSKIIAPVGATYTQVDGTYGKITWAKETGSSSTGWYKINQELNKLWTTQRPYLCSYGDSVNEQDIPDTAGTGTHNFISPMFWLNALSNCAFDYIGPYSTTFVPTAGGQTPTVTWRNGMAGSSGALVTQAMKYGIDGYLSIVTAQRGSRPFAVWLSSGFNDLANNDTANYDDTIWTELLTIINKVHDAGGMAMLCVRQASSNFDTKHKRRNREALADTLLTYAAGRNDTVVGDVDAAWRKYGKGVTLERATRGTTGDKVHPNSIGAVLYGLALRDALKGYVSFTPPWERQDFAGTILNSTISDMAGDTGTKGTGAHASSVVPAGWDLLNYGGVNTSVITAQVPSNVGPSVQLILTATGAPTSDGFGLAQISYSALSASTNYRFFVDMDVIRAQYIHEIHAGIQYPGGSFYWIGGGSSSDRRDDTATSPNHTRILEGQRLVLSSFPFTVSAGNAGLHRVGGGQGIHDASGRAEFYTRFAGIIQQ